MGQILDFSYEALSSWWTGVRAWSLSRREVVGDEQFRRGIGAFYASIAIVAGTHYAVLRASGVPVSAGDLLLLQVAPAANYLFLGALLMGAFRVVAGRYPPKHVATCVLLVLCGLMCVTTFASVEQFSTGTRMFLERRDPAVSYVTAAIPELWKSSGTVELRARLIVEVVVQLAAIGLYLIAWLPRVAATVVPPMTHARIRLTLGVLLALAVQLVVLERITNQIQWNMVAAVVGLK